MRSHRWLALAATALWLVACGAEFKVFGDGRGDSVGGGDAVGGSDTLTLVGPGSGGTSSDGGAGGISQGGEGGQPLCQDASDCDDTTGDCLEPACDNNECTTTNATDSTPCTVNDGDLCNARGACLKADGRICSNATECHSELCVDGVCCATNCNGVCEACNIEGSAGACSPHVGTDPHDECTPGVCDGLGDCVSGEPDDVTLIGQNGDEFAFDIALDATGNLYVIGYFRGDLTLGGTTFSSVGDSFDLFVVKLDPQGVVLWGTVLGDDEDQFGRKLQLTDSGDVLVAGWFNGELAFEPASPLQANGQDGFVALLDGASGKPTWSASIGGPDNQSGGQMVRDLAIDSTGGVIVGGWFAGSIDFGSGTTTPSAGFNDAFVAKYSGAGGFQHARTFGDANGDGVYGLAVDNDDNILITGYYYGTLEFDGTALPTAESADLFIAKLDNDADPIWAKGFGGQWEQFPRGIAVDSNGSVVIAGYYHGAPNLGGADLINNDDWECFVAKYDDDGNHLWSGGFGDDANQYLFDVAVDSNDNVITTGYFGGSIDFGGGPLSTPDGVKLILAKLNPNGQHLWSAAYGSGGANEAAEGFGLAMGSNDRIALAGFHIGGIDFGSGETESSGWDVIAATFLP